MGIHNLTKFLRNNCIQVFEEIHISEYAYKKVAIDTSLYLCHFKASVGDRWLSAFVNLVACLRKNEIHCVFIYDTGAPPEKTNEKMKRSDNRAKLESRVFELEESVEHYNLTGEIKQNLIDLYEKIIKKEENIRLLKKSSHEKTIDIDSVIKKVEKMRTYILEISPEDFTLTKKLFDILQVPWYDAPMEAENMCADLQKRGLVDAVLSDDSDVLAYGADNFLTKLNISTNTCIRIRYPNVLESLDLSSNSFLDLCIMCGTDYNKNIFKVGPENAYKYLLKYGSIEEIAKNVTNNKGIPIDISILNHEKVRELFTKYSKSNITSIPYCGMPKFEDLRDFVFKYNLKLEIQSMKKCFIKEFVIEDYSNDEK